jgi:hypothetical protein
MSFCTYLCFVQTFIFNFWFSFLNFQHIFQSDLYLFLQEFQPHTKLAEKITCRSMLETEQHKTGDT